MPKGIFKIVLCDKCNKEVSSNALTRHVKACDGISGPKPQPLLKVNEYRQLENGCVECPYCQDSFLRTGIHVHINSVHLGKSPAAGITSWNKGLTKETDARIAASGIKNSITQTGKVGWKLSQEQKDHMSKVAKERGLGGVTQSRWIDYNGVKLGSSYELTLAKSLDEHGVKWEICSRIKYVDPNGKSRTYTPDFYLPEYNVYLDPKNDFLINKINPALGFNDLVKIKLVEEQNSIKIYVLNSTQLSWDYVKTLITL